MWVYGLDWASPGQGQVADACECDNEPSGSVKCGEFLDSLQTSQFLKKDSAPWSKYGGSYTYMVAKLVSCINVRPMGEGFREQGAVLNILIRERGNNGRSKITVQLGAS